MGLNEIAYVTIPSDADEKLVKALDDNGIAHFPYDVVKNDSEKTDENRTEATNEGLSVAEGTLFSKKVNPKLNIRDANTIHIDDLYDNVPKEFRGALFDIDDRIDFTEFDEVRSEIYAEASRRRRKHSSMRFADRCAVGNHEFLFENISLTDFRVYEIASIDPVDRRIVDAKEELTRNLTRLLKALGMTKDTTLGILSFLKTDEMKMEMTRRLVEEHPKTKDEIMEILLQVKGHHTLEK